MAIELDIPPRSAQYISVAVTRKVVDIEAVLWGLQNRCSTDERTKQEIGEAIKNLDELKQLIDGRQQ